jgi:FkbM family methyltransferase
MIPAATSVPKGDSMPSRSLQQIVEKFIDWVKAAGLPAALTWGVFQTKKALGFQQPSALKIKPRQTRYPVIARLRGSSDMEVVNQIFVVDEYACVRNISSPRLIFDLGANVGYSSAYFLTCFPNATVVAVEPDPGNFELCRKNLAPYGDRAKVVLGAVWSKRARLKLSRDTFGDGREWATQVRESEDDEDQATVDGWDIPSLLHLVGGTHIDLLKIDIERSELEIFGASSSSWLSKVRNICIELHGPDCKEVFLDALKDFDYDLGSSGELTVSWNLQRKTTSAQRVPDQNLISA